MTPCVLDASVSGCWPFAEGSEPLPQRALAWVKEYRAWVPWIWWFEARNLLLVSERRGRLAPGAVEEQLAYLRQLPIGIDAEPVESAIIRLAREHGLTIYDAAYLEVARRKHYPLATLDRKLKMAAIAEGVRLLTTDQASG